MKSLSGGLLQSTNTPLYLVPVNQKTTFNGLYISNPSTVILSFSVSVILVSGKELIQGNGTLNPGESSQLFTGEEDITLVSGEKLIGKCNEATDTLQYTLYGENYPINS